MRTSHSAVLVVTFLVLLASCGRRDEGREVQASLGASTTQVSIPAPVLPVADDEGTAWFLAARPDTEGAYQLTAADAQGWSESVALPENGAADAEPTLLLAPSGRGVMAVITKCNDPRCGSSDLVVTGYERDGDDITNVSSPWVVQRDPRSSGAAPRPVATRGGVALLQDSYQLLEFRDGSPPGQYTLPNGAGDPCLTTDGSVLAIEVSSSSSGSAGVTSPTAITPDQQPSEDLSLKMLQLNGKDWSVVPGSERLWRDTYQVGAEFHCGTTGPYYATTSQPATLSWGDGWVDLQPPDIEWDLSAKSTASGPLGIREGALILVDPTSDSASLLANLRLPASAASALEAAVATSNSTSSGLVSGWLAVGGRNLDTGVMCLDTGSDSEVTCHVFS